MFSIIETYITKTTKRTRPEGENHKYTAQVVIFGYFAFSFTRTDMITELTLTEVRVFASYHVTPWSSIDIIFLRDVLLLATVWHLFLLDHLWLLILY